MPYLVRVARAALILSFASANWSFSSCTVVAFRTSSGATASATGLMSGSYSDRRFRASIISTIRKVVLAAVSSVKEDRNFSVFWLAT